MSHTNPYLELEITIQKEFNANKAFFETSRLVLVEQKG